MGENDLMQISREDLSQYYASVSDAELLAIDQHELTDLAVQCYDRELEGRHLSQEMEPDNPAQEIDAQEEAPPDWLDTVATACSFQVGSGPSIQRKPSELVQFCPTPAFRTK